MYRSPHYRDTVGNPSILPGLLVKIYPDPEKVGTSTVLEFFSQPCLYSKTVLDRVTLCPKIEVLSVASQITNCLTPKCVFYQPSFYPNSDPRLSYTSPKDGGLATLCRKTEVFCYRKYGTDCDKILLTQFDFFYLRLHASTLR